MGRIHCAFLGAMLAMAGAHAVPSELSSKGPGYIINISKEIFAVDLTTGNFSQIGTFPYYIGDVAVLNSTTAYATDYAFNNVYKLNLQTGALSLVNRSSLDPTMFQIEGIAFPNANTAYTVALDGGMFRVNLKTGASSTLVTFPASVGPADIAILNESLAYVTGFSDGNIYAVDLKTGSYRSITKIPLTTSANDLYGIVLLNQTTAACTLLLSEQVILVDLTTGTGSLIADLPLGTFPLNLNATDGNTLYAESFGGNQRVYRIDIATGAVTLIATLPGANATGLGLLLQMRTEGLTQNNLAIANYFNANGPINVIRSFALLEGDLGKALEAASPARNAFTTYAAQNTYLAASQTLIDYSR